MDAAKHQVQQDGPQREDEGPESQARGRSPDGPNQEPRTSSDWNNRCGGYSSTEESGPQRIHEGDIERAEKGSAGRSRMGSTDYAQEGSAQISEGTREGGSTYQEDAGQVEGDGARQGGAEEEPGETTIWLGMHMDAEEAEATTTGTTTAKDSHWKRVGSTPSGGEGTTQEADQVEAHSPQSAAATVEDEWHWAPGR